MKATRAIALGALLVGALVYLTYQGWFAFQHRHNNDFKHMYLGMNALYAGESPYPAITLFRQAEKQGMGNVSLNPYVYLPFTGLALGFLKPMSFTTASTVWFFINHVLMLASLWLIAKAIFKDRLLGLVVAVWLVAPSHPLIRTLLAGQLNIVLLFCVAAAYLLLLKNREKSASAILAFAAMFKIAPFIFLPYFVATKRWKGVAAFLLVTAVLLGISMALVGVQIHRDFYPVLRQMGYGHSTWEDLPRPPVFWKDPYNQSLNSFFTHALVLGNRITAPWIYSTQSVANSVTVFSTLILSAAMLFAGLKLMSLKGGTEEFGESEQAFFHATVLFMLLVPSLMWDHYLVLLILPVCWFLQRSWKRRKYGVPVTTLACALIVMVPWSPEQRGFRQGAGILMMSLKLWPTLVLFALLITETLRALNGKTGSAEQVSAISATPESSSKELE